jgi:hypothetical protein
MPAPYNGGCQCGSVRYVLTTEPIRVAACHCKECQRQSGSVLDKDLVSRTIKFAQAGGPDIRPVAIHITEYGLRVQQRREIVVR